MLDALLVLLYSTGVTWLIIATFLNYILKPVHAISSNRNYEIGGWISLYYAVLWGMVFALPVLKVALLGE